MNLDPNELSVRKKLDSLCNQFEDHWELEHSLEQIENICTGITPELRSPLLQELIKVDVELRSRQKHAPSADDYRPLGTEAFELAVNAIAQLDQTQFATRSLNDLDASTLSGNIDTAGLGHDEFSLHQTQTMENPTGLTIGNYQVLKHLGQGGMGTVYLAVHQRFRSRLYAIKFVKAEKLNERMIERFNAEIDVLENLIHPNIVYAQDAGRLNQSLYLVMEYVDGVVLSDIKKHLAPIHSADAVEIVIQAARGLAFANQQNIVHRDIKPSNIMVSRAGEAKILDLGLAKAIFQEGRDLTQSGQILGTPDYMAPEQWQGDKDIDIRADLYSLGCTFYSLLTGRAPFEDEEHSSLNSKLYGHLHHEPPRLAHFEHLSELPDLQPIVSRMLAKSPSERYQTPEELIAVLEPHAAQSNLVDLVRQLSPEPLQIDELIQDTKRPSSTEPSKPALDQSTAQMDKDIQPIEHHPTPGFSFPNPIVSALLLIAVAVTIWYAMSGHSGTGPASLNPETEQKTQAVSADLQVNYFEIVNPSLPFDSPQQELTPPVSVQDVSTVHFNNLLRVSARFEKPQYAMLIALNPTNVKGGIQLCWPVEHRSQPITSLEYPEKNTSFFPMTDGIGQQVFLLLHSSSPLAEFADWQQQLGEYWEVNSHNGVWLATDDVINPVWANGDTRGDVIDLAPTCLEQLVNNLRMTHREVHIKAIAFPIEE